MVACGSNLHLTVARGRRHPFICCMCLKPGASHANRYCPQQHKASLRQVYGRIDQYARTERRECHSYAARLEPVEQPPLHSGCATRLGKRAGLGREPCSSRPPDSCGVLATWSGLGGPGSTFSSTASHFAESAVPAPPADRQKKTGSGC